MTSLTCVLVKREVNPFFGRTSLNFKPWTLLGQKNCKFVWKATFLLKNWDRSTQFHRKGPSIADADDLEPGWLLLPHVWDENTLGRIRRLTNMGCLGFFIITSFLPHKFTFLLQNYHLLLICTFYHSHLVIFSFPYHLYRFFVLNCRTEQIFINEFVLFVWAFSNTMLLEYVYIFMNIHTKTDQLFTQLSKLSNFVACFFIWVLYRYIEMFNQMSVIQPS